MCVSQLQLFNIIFLLKLFRYIMLQTFNLMITKPKVRYINMV